VVFSGGGEPTLHPQFFQIVAQAKLAGLKVGLVTNGSKEAMLAASYMLSWVRVSMDGGTDELYSKIRRVKSGEFERVIANLWAMRQANLDLVIGTHFLVSDENLEIVPEFLKRLHGVGANYAVLKFPVATDWYKPITVSLERIKQIAEGSPLTTYFNGDPDRDPVGNAGLPCWASRLNAVIAADGKLYVCCRLVGEQRYDDALLGDLNTGSFLEVWQSEAAVAKAKSLLDAKNTESCPRCWMTRFNRTLASLSPEDLASMDFV